MLGVFDYYFQRIFVGYCYKNVSLCVDINQLKIIMKYTLVLFIAASSFFIVSCGGSKSNKEDAQNDTELANDSTNKKKVTPGTYCNEKYKFCITFPQEMMEPQDELENGVGQEFVSPDGQAKLRVALGNLDGTISGNLNIKKAYEADLKILSKLDVSLKSFKTSYYTLTWVEGKTIFYQKTIISNGELATAVLSYESKSKDTYYPMIEPTFKSFK